MVVESGGESLLEVRKWEGKIERKSFVIFVDV
jgi:hypothetical protein